MTKSVDVKGKEVKVLPLVGNGCNEMNESFPSRFVSCYKVSTPEQPAPAPEQPGTILVKY